jgi:MATE family multidrug resistance protein
MPGDALAEETRATLRLAWPIVLTNLTQFALTLTDALFLGRLGTEALAGATLGANLYWALLAPVFGLALAAAPLCAQTRGRGRGFVRGMRRDLRAAVWAAAFGVLPVWACCRRPRASCWPSGRSRRWRGWRRTTSTP